MNTCLHLHTCKQMRRVTCLVTTTSVCSSRWRPMMFICARCSSAMRGAVHAVAAHRVQQASVSARKAAIFCSCTAAVALRPANNLHAHHGLDSQGQMRRSYNPNPLHLATPVQLALPTVSCTVHSRLREHARFRHHTSTLRLTMTKPCALEHML